MFRLHGVVLSHPLMMVTELAPLGSLLDYLHKECSHTSICTLWQFASQVTAQCSHFFFFLGLPVLVQLIMFRLHLVWHP